jgi:N-carbamoylputrescine amidase
VTPTTSPEAVRKATLEKHLSFVEHAGRRGVEVRCLQECFDLPYLAPSRDPRWVAQAAPLPDATIEHLVGMARNYAIVIVAPVIERDGARVYHATAILDADGTLCARYHKRHFAQALGFGERDVFLQATLDARAWPRGTHALVWRSATTVTSPRARGRCAIGAQS